MSVEPTPTSHSPDVTADVPLEIPDDVVEHTVRGRDGEEVIFRGRKLAHASSQQDEHRHRTRMDDGRFLYAPPGWKCPACRWFEVTIYRVYDDLAPLDAKYLVHTLGRSIVPGEIDYARAAWADTPFKVLELLTQWRRDRPVLPDASVEVIEKAADLDPEIAEAYEQWLAAGVG